MRTARPQPRTTQPKVAGSPKGSIPKAPDAYKCSVCHYIETEDPPRPSPPTTKTPRPHRVAHGPRWLRCPNEGPENCILASATGPRSYRSRVCFPIEGGVRLCTPYFLTWSKSNLYSSLKGWDFKPQLELDELWHEWKLDQALEQLGRPASMKFSEALRLYERTLGSMVGLDTVEGRYYLNKNRDTPGYSPETLMMLISDPKVEALVD